MGTIGIDVSKATLDVVLQDDQGNLVTEECVKNSHAGLRALLRKWGKRGLCDGSTLVCLEPTGHYSYGVVKTLVELGQPTWVAHATDIRMSIGMQRGKSDKVDARRIAQYAHRFRDKVRLLKPSCLDFIEIKTLLALRQRLVKQRATHRAQVKDNVVCMMGPMKELVKAELERQLKALDRSITKLEKAVVSLLAKDPELVRKNRLAQTVSGVGPVLACELIAHTEGFTRFESPRQLVCYVGAAPFEKTSGTSVRGRTGTSSFANQRLKSLLRMAALAAVRVNGDLRDYYLRKLEQGKRPIVVLNNVAGKIIHHLWATIKNNKPYEPFLQVP